MQAFYQAELRPDLLAGQHEAVRLGRRMMAGTTLFATDLFSDEAKLCPSSAQHPMHDEHHAREHHEKGEKLPACHAQNRLGARVRLAQ